MLAVCLAVFGVTVAGCSGRRTKPGYIKLTGIVQYEGKPLQRGSVLFAPSLPGDTGSALIGVDGSFSVMLAPGDYSVAVRCYDDDATISESGEYTPPTSLIPERYTDANDSGLTVSVKAGVRPVSFSLSR
jgi:hypothetical protein